MSGGVMSTVRQSQCLLVFYAALAVVDVAFDYATIAQYVNASHSDSLGLVDLGGHSLTWSRSSHESRAT